MKITKEQLKELIKEELENTLIQEGDFDEQTGLPLTKEAMLKCMQDAACKKRIMGRPLIMKLNGLKSQLEPAVGPDMASLIRISLADYTTGEPPSPQDVARFMFALYGPNPQE